MILEEKEINQIKKAFKPEFARIDNRFNELEDRVTKLFKDQTQTMRGWLDDFKELMSQSYTTVEAHQELKDNVELLEDSVNEVRSNSGMILREGTGKYRVRKKIKIGESRNDEDSHGLKSSGE